MNSISFVGNLTADPKPVTSASGNTRTTFTVAVNEGQGDDKKAHFVDCTAFGTLGENALSLHKGTRVIVVGSLNTYTKEVEINEETKKLTMVTFRADAVGPDLRFATASVSKVARSSADSNGSAEGKGSASGGSSPDASSDADEDEGEAEPPKAKAKKAAVEQSDDF